MAEEGNVVTVGPHGQVISSHPSSDGQGRIIFVDANGNVIGEVKVSKSGKLLPQTGEKNNEAGILGLALSVLGLFGFAVDRKRKKND